MLSHLTKYVKELFQDLKGRGQKRSLGTFELNQFEKVDKGVRNQTIRFITEEAALEKVDLMCDLHRASCPPSRPPSRLQFWVDTAEAAEQTGSGPLPHRLGESNRPGPPPSAPHG